jgi:hypothetical protein
MYYFPALSAGGKEQTAQTYKVKLCLKRLTSGFAVLENAFVRIMISVIITGVVDVACCEEDSTFHFHRFQKGCCSQDADIYCSAAFPYV